jgi:hypothetical protein
MVFHISFQIFRPLRFIFIPDPGEESQSTTEHLFCQIAKPSGLPSMPSASASSGKLEHRIGREDAKP